MKHVNGVVTEVNNWLTCNAAKGRAGVARPTNSTRTMAAINIICPDRHRRGRTAERSFATILHQSRIDPSKYLCKHALAFGPVQQQMWSTVETDQFLFARKTLVQLGDMQAADQIVLRARHG